MKIPLIAALTLFTFGESQLAYAQTTLDIWTDTIKTNIEGFKIAIPKPFLGGKVIKNDQNRLGIANEKDSIITPCWYDAVGLLDSGYYALRKDGEWFLQYKYDQIGRKSYTDIRYLANPYTTVTNVLLVQQNGFWNVLDHTGEVLYKNGFDKIIGRNINFDGMLYYGVRGSEVYALNLTLWGESKINTFKTYYNDINAGSFLYNLLLDKDVFYMPHKDVRELSPSLFAVENGDSQFAIYDTLQQNKPLSFQYNNIKTAEPAIYALDDGKNWSFYANSNQLIGTIPLADCNMEAYPNCVLQKKGNGYLVLDKMLQPIFEEVYTDIKLYTAYEYKDMATAVEGTCKGKRYVLDVQNKVKMAK